MILARARKAARIDAAESQIKEANLLIHGATQHLKEVEDSLVSIQQKSTQV